MLEEQMKYWPQKNHVKNKLDMVVLTNKMRGIEIDGGENDSTMAGPPMSASANTAATAPLTPTVEPIRAFGIFDACGFASE